MACQLKKLLIISPRYPHKYDQVSEFFVYSQVNELKKYFKKIIVISTTPYIPKFLSFFLAPIYKRDSESEDYKYDNVEVYFTKSILLPFKSYLKKRGEIEYQKTKKILARIKFVPEIIHCHFIWPSGYIGIKLKEEMKIPCIITAHGYDVYEIPFRNDYYTREIKRILINSDNIITVSQKNKLILTDKLSIPNKKITLIPNGFDPKLFYPQNKTITKIKLNLPVDKKIILSVGHLEPVKGHIYLVESAKEILKKRKDILFIIVGSGPEENFIKKKIKEYGLTDYFLLTGAKSHQEIPVWMNSCDIFTMSSLNEGVPTVLFEAIACGKPFVGTNVGGIPEIISNENLGILVNPKDPNALVNALIRTINKRWDTDYIVNYSKQYTWNVLSEQIFAIYRKIIG